MILDERNEFCDATALNTGAAGTYNIGDVIDTSVGRDLGGDQSLFLVIQAATQITSGGAGTVAFQLVSDGTGTIATDGTQTVHARSLASAAPIAAGTVLFVIQLPQEGAAYERYLAVQQITGTAALTGGSVDAFLTTDVKRFKAYDAPFHL